MKTQSPENESLTLSLREILAGKGIATSHERDSKGLQMRRGRKLTPQNESAATIPGIEVTYLDFDSDLWELPSSLNK